MGWGGRSNQSRGFTLIELITVIVILAIVAAMGSSFVVSAMESYNSTQQRSKLINRSRQALERMGRQLRDALPHGVRVTNSNNCVEFLPVAAAANYLNQLPDVANGAPAASVISTAPFVLDFGTIRFASVAPLANSEIFGGGAGSIEAVSSTTATSITLSSAQQWLRNSVRRRIYLADAASAFCVDGGNLRVYEDYDTSLPLSSVTPNGSGILMGERVAAVGANPVFSISNATEDRNAVVTIQISFSEGGETVEFVHRVMVRNVP